MLVHDGSGRCPAHPVKAWSQRSTAVKRMTGRRLQRARERLMRLDPQCAECRRLGIVRAGTQRDHVIPLAEGGADDETNEQLLCDDHHREKSLSEALRGRGRSKV